MAGLKELRIRVKSIQNTKKITYAMKLVSAAKLRKAQESVVRSRQYTEAVGRAIREIAAEAGNLDFSHPLMERREHVRKIRVLVIGGARGLCGGYNTNIHKRIEALKREKSGVEFEWVLLGKKPAEYFRRRQYQYIKSIEGLPDDPNRWPIDDLCEEFSSDFVSGKFDEAFLIYTRFKSAISMTVMCEKLLPLEAGLPAQQHSHASAGQVNGHAASGVTLFEPSARQLFAALIPRILRSIVRQAALDARTSEHGSRMTAMDNATKNAGELIDSLSLKCNKLRQGKITSELLDIIGGAEAIK